jgi:hypothetical protein
MQVRIMHICWLTTMSKGYQVIEPDALSPWVRNPSYDVFSVAILSWLCSRLQREFKDYAEYVDIEVIRVTYVSSYPAIGIHYKDESFKDIGPIVEAAINRILQERAILEFVEFFGNDKVNWNEIVERVMRKGVNQ